MDFIVTVLATQNSFTYQAGAAFEPCAGDTAIELQEWSRDD